LGGAYLRLTEPESTTMPRLLSYFDPAYAFLANIDPSLPRALFVALVFTSVLLWRKFAPVSWSKFSNLIPVSEADTSWFKATLQKAWQALPAALLGAIYGALGTGGDVVATLKLALLGLLAPLVHELAWRYQGNLGTPSGKLPPPGDSRPVAAKPSDPHVFLQNEDGSPIEMRAGWRHKEWRFAMPLALAVLVASCSPSAWQAQRDASNVVAHVANDTVEPALLAAYRSTGLLVVRAQNTREDAQVALSLHQERWKPVWRAWAGFEAAHAAWQSQIEAQADPLPAAMAARKSFCELRELTKGDWGVELPDFPGPLACPAVTP
jgi:hypothetical protein